MDELMHPNDACKHGTALPLCQEGCIEEQARAYEQRVADITNSLNELSTMRANLTAAQARCTELLQENRRLNKELAMSDATVQALTRTIGLLEVELDDLLARS